MRRKRPTSLDLESPEDDYSAESDVIYSAYEESMSIDHLSSISSTSSTTSKHTQRSITPDEQDSDNETQQEDLSSLDYTSYSSSEPSESLTERINYCNDLDYIFPNKQPMNMDIKPGILGFELMDIYISNSDNDNDSENDSELLHVEDDKYIDIDDYFDTDDEYYDNECDESTLNLNYSIYKNNNNIKCVDLDTMVNELDEINKWIKFIRAINKMCDYEQIKYINKNISIELVNYSNYELRIKQTKCNTDIMDINGEIIDNISFDKYPINCNIGSDGYSYEELRLQMEININYNDNNYEELNGDFKDYIIFDEMDVNINELININKYKSNNYLDYKSTRWIRENMRNSDEYKTQVVYNKELINIFIEMLDINNNNLQREILYILKYIAHKNTESVVIFNKLFIDLMNKNDYHTQKSTLYALSKISEISSCRDILLDNRILPAMIQIFKLYKDIIYEDTDSDIEMMNDRKTFIIPLIETILFNICNNGLNQCYLDAIYVPKILQLCGIIIDPEQDDRNFYSTRIQSIFKYLNEMNKIQKIFNGNIILDETEFINQYNQKQCILLFDGFIRQCIKHVIVPIDIHQIFFAFCDIFNNKNNRCIFDSLVDLWYNEEDDKAIEPIIDGIYDNNNHINTIIKCIKFINDYKLYSNKTIVNKKLNTRIIQLLDWNDNMLQKQAAIFVLKNGIFSNEELAFKMQCNNGNNGNDMEELKNESFDTYPLLWSWDWNTAVKTELNTFKFENMHETSCDDSDIDDYDDSGYFRSFEWSFNKKKRVIYKARKTIQKQKSEVNEIEKKEDENKINEWTSAWTMTSNNDNNNNKSQWKMPSNMFTNIMDTNDNNTQQLKWKWPTDVPVDNNQPFSFDFNSKNESQPLDEVNTWQFESTENNDNDDITNNINSWSFFNDKQDITNDISKPNTD